MQLPSSSTVLPFPNELRACQLLVLFMTNTSKTGDFKRNEKGEKERKKKKTQTTTHAQISPNPNRQEPGKQLHGALPEMQTL